jgi:hypothetical protein
MLNPEEVCQLAFGPDGYQGRFNEQKSEYCMKIAFRRMPLLRKERGASTTACLLNRSTICGSMRLSLSSALKRAMGLLDDPRDPGPHEILVCGFQLDP